MERNLGGRPWLALFLGLTLAACSGGQEEQAPTPAPDFTLRTVDGNQLSLSDHAGKVVLLDFWATWCPPCRAAIPHTNELQSRYGPEGFVVLGMNMDQNPDDLVTFLSRTTVAYPIVKVDDATRQAYGGVVNIPQMFLIDRQGMVRKRYMGFDFDIAEDLEQRIGKLLAEGT